MSEKNINLGKQTEPEATSRNSEPIVRTTEGALDRLTRVAVGIATGVKIALKRFTSGPEKKLPIIESIDSHRKIAEILLDELLAKSNNAHDPKGITLGKEEIVEGWYSGYKEMISLLERHYDGTHTDDRKVWVQFIEHLKSCKDKKNNILSIGSDLELIDKNLKKSPLVIAAIVKHLNSPHIRQIIETLSVLYPIIDMKTPDIVSGDTVEIDRIIATVNYLAGDKHIKDIAGAFKNHKGTMTVGAMYEIAEALDATG